ncbi:MAG: hypothetical protein IVW56_01510 [Candidatus Binataceae bacterium]|nr:hypothetical protein [Candidatus Binataceae bacterium]
MALIEPTTPGAGDKRPIDPCARCGHEEGVWSVPWPDQPTDAFYLLCGRCLWRRFHDVPRGAVRRELVRKVFAQRIFGRHTS